MKRALQAITILVFIGAVVLFGGAVTFGVKFEAAKWSTFFNAGLPAFLTKCGIALLIALMLDWATPNPESGQGTISTIMSSLTTPEDRRTACNLLIGVLITMAICMHGTVFN